MSALEKEIEAKLGRTIKKHGGLCLKWTCPGWSGVPDRIILLPGGQVIFAELKRPDGGRASELQRWWNRKLKDLGFISVFICSEHDVDLLDSFIRDVCEQGG